MDILPLDGPHDAPPEALIINTFELAPSQGAKVDLGTYRNAKRTPAFRMYVHDADRLESPGAIVYSDLLLHDLDGPDYRLIRHVQSYSQVTHTITVSFASKTDERLKVT